MRFHGKSAIVTGASRGIGRAISLELARQGCNIAFNYARSKDSADALVSEIIATGREAFSYNIDVSDHQAVLEMVRDVSGRFGSVAILVNNAGIIRDRLILRMSESEWDEVIRTNLKGVFNFCKAVAPVMLKARSGSVLNITSASGLHGMPGQANYCASKAGMIGITKALAKEFAGRKVTVNALALGFIETAMTDTLSDAYKSQLLQNIPLGRFGSTNEAARVAAFLVSDDAAYITGQVIQMDGGLAM